MGFYDDYATPVEDIPTGFGLPVGTYPVVVTDIKPHAKEDGTKSILLELTVDTVADEKGRKGKETIWLTKPVQGAKNADIHASVGKQWFNSLGLEAEQAEKGFNPFKHKDKIIGVEGVLAVTPGKGGYTNKAFQRTAESGVSDIEVPEEKTEVALDVSNW